MTCLSPRISWGIFDQAALRKSLKRLALAHNGIKNDRRKSLVRVVGLEPTLLAKTDFESVASTIPPHPHISTLLVATRSCNRLRGPISSKPHGSDGGLARPNGPVNATFMPNRTVTVSLPQKYRKTTFGPISNPSQTSVVVDQRCHV